MFKEPELFHKLNNALLLFGYPEINPQHKTVNKKYKDNNIVSYNVDYGESSKIKLYYSWLQFTWCRVYIDTFISIPFDLESHPNYIHIEGAVIFPDAKIYCIENHPSTFCLETKTIEEFYSHYGYYIDYFLSFFVKGIHQHG